MRKENSLGAYPKRQKVMIPYDQIFKKTFKYTCLKNIHIMSMKLTHVNHNHTEYKNPILRDAL